MQLAYMKKGCDAILDQCFVFYSRHIYKQVFVFFIN